MSIVVEVATPNEPFPPMEDHHRSLWKDCALECVGTFSFVYIALAGVSQVVLSGSSDQLHVALCFALGLTSGIVIAGKSGGHLNPAVSMTVYLTDPWFCTNRFLGYIISQFVGAFVAALVVIAVYYGWINEGPDELSVGSFGTFKNPNNSLFGSILDQFIGAALLMFAILRVPDSRFKPAIIGIVLGGIALFNGSNGFAINPARDFGPRLASSIVFGDLAFTKEDHWFWVPLVIPFFGAPFGYALHLLMKLID